jgi:hypothetical protein
MGGKLFGIIAAVVLAVATVAIRILLMVWLLLYVANSALRRHLAAHRLHSSMRRSSAQ